MSRCLLKVTAGLVEVLLDALLRIQTLRILQPACHEARYDLYHTRL